MWRSVLSNPSPRGLAHRTRDRLLRSWLIPTIGLSDPLLDVSLFVQRPEMDVLQSVPSDIGVDITFSLLL